MGDAADRVHERLEGAVMNMEISEEAKIALANIAQAKARARLVHDGASSNAAMRRRPLALVTERNLPAAEYAKLLHKRIMASSVHEFCRKHNVSLDWLMYGDLKGLQRMKQWAKEDHGKTADERPARILRKLLALPPATQRAGTRMDRCGNGGQLQCVNRKPRRLPPR